MFDLTFRLHIHYHDLSFGAPKGRVHRIKLSMCNWKHSSLFSTIKYKLWEQLVYNWTLANMHWDESRAVNLYKIWYFQLNNWGPANRHRGTEWLYVPFCRLTIQLHSFRNAFSDRLSFDIEEFPRFFLSHARRGKDHDLFFLYSRLRN